MSQGRVFGDGVKFVDTTITGDNSQKALSDFQGNPPIPNLHVSGSMPMKNPHSRSAMMWKPMRL